MSCRFRTLALVSVHGKCVKGERMDDRDWLNQIARAILLETSTAAGHEFPEEQVDSTVTSKIASIVGIAINEASLEARRAKDQAFAVLLSAVVEAAGGEIVVEQHMLAEPLPCERIRKRDGKLVFRSVRKRKSEISETKPR